MARTPATDTSDRRQRFDEASQIPEPCHAAGTVPAVRFARPPWMAGDGDEGAVAPDRSRSCRSRSRGVTDPQGDCQSRQDGTGGFCSCVDLACRDCSWACKAERRRACRSDPILGTVVDHGLLCVRHDDQTADAATRGGSTRALQPVRPLSEASRADPGFVAAESSGTGWSRRLTDVPPRSPAPVRLPSGRQVSNRAIQRSERGSPNAPSDSTAPRRVCNDVLDVPWSLTLWKCMEVLGT